MYFNRKLQRLTSNLSKSIGIQDINFSRKISCKNAEEDHIGVSDITMKRMPNVCLRKDKIDLKVKATLSVTFQVHY